MKSKMLVSLMYSSIFLSLLSFSLLQNLNMHAFAEATTVYVNPQRQQVGLSVAFTVNINISNVVNLYGYEVKLLYKTAELDVFRVELPPRHFFAGKSYFIAKNETNDAFNSTHGYVWLAMSLLAPASPQNGKGELFKIIFQSIAVGNSSISLGVPNPTPPPPAAYTKLSDPTPALIPHVSVDGSVLVTGIKSVSRSAETPNYDEDVNVIATIIDPAGVDEAILSFTLYSMWRNVTMTPLGGVVNTYCAVIPQQRYSTLVHYKVYANNTAGIWAISKTFSYAVVDVIKPRIRSVNWTPSEPRANDYVKVSANISEPVNSSGLDKVRFSFKDSFNQWWNTSMTYNATSELWSAIIPMQPGNFTVNFLIIEAIDKAGNIGTSKTYSYFTKNIIPGDLNKDGIVDIIDLVAIAIHFGETDP